MKTKRILITASIYIVLIIGIILLITQTGLNSLESLQEIVSSAGIFGYIIYFLLTFLFMIGQFLPTAIVIIAGVYAFGIWQGIIVGCLAVLIGAIGLYFVGRKYGVKVAKWIADGKDIDKWQEKLNKGKYTLFILLLFPASPDSLLYLLAGIGKIKFKTYLIMLILSKPIGVVLTALLGGGAIIPLTWSYAWLWAILGLIMGLLIWLSIKYQDKLDNIFKKRN